MNLIGSHHFYHFFHDNKDMEEEVRSQLRPILSEEETRGAATEDVIVTRVEDPRSISQLVKYF